MSSLILTCSNIAALMTTSDYLSAVKTAFANLNAGSAAPPPLEIAGLNGAFHAKGAVLHGRRNFAALKLNGNFPDNADHGLPTIQGVIILCDAATGAVLALMDSIEVTLRRTAAASALAAQYLARRESKSLAIIGCGAQAMAQADALADIFDFKTGRVFDSHTARAAQFAEAASARHGFRFEVAPDVSSASRGCDIIVCCTTAQAPIIDHADVSPGAFIAAIGADNPEKNEIAPALMARAKVVADVLDQCVIMGDLRSALEAGTMRASDTYAELADIVAERIPGRTKKDDIFIFDSTGVGIQDVASAAIIFERAINRSVGQRINLT